MYMKIKNMTIYQVYLLLLAIRTLTLIDRQTIIFGMLT